MAGGKGVVGPSPEEPFIFGDHQGPRPFCLQHQQAGRRAGRPHPPARARTGDGQSWAHSHFCSVWHPLALPRQTGQLVCHRLAATSQAREGSLRNPPKSAGWWMGVRNDAAPTGLSSGIRSLPRAQMAANPRRQQLWGHPEVCCPSFPAGG